MFKPDERHFDRVAHDGTPGHPVASGNGVQPLELCDLEGDARADLELLMVVSHRIGTTPPFAEEKPNNLIIPS